MDARISTSSGHDAASATATAPAPAKMITSKSYALSGKIMLSAIVSLLAVVLLVLCLHVYSRWYFLRLARRRRLARAFARRAAAAAGSASGGLDPDLVKSLPMFNYSPPEQGKGDQCPPPAECAVCLCEFEKRDHGRVLPPCGHVFHAECIAMWFYSHSTCPLCRAPVQPAPTKVDPAAAVAAACRCGEEGGNQAGTPSSCSASASSSGSGSPESSSTSSMARCLPDLDYRTARAGGVTEGGLDFDLERGERAVMEPTPPTANTTSSKTRTSS